MIRFLNKYKILFLGVLALMVMQSFSVSYPKVFVIGDSISMHYGAYLEKSLSGFYIYDRKRGTDKNLDDPNGANGGDSAMVLAYLKELKNDNDFKTDYLLLNCGLHDIKRKPQADTTQISLKKYKDNLLSIIHVSEEMQINLVWVNSTPVADTIHNKRVPFFRFEKDLIAYNKAADSIMQQANVPVIDLYMFTKKYTPNGYLDHIHYKDEIRKRQADFIAGNLTAIFNCKQDD